MNLILIYIKRKLIYLKVRIIQGYKVYTHKLYLNDEQQKETAKIFLRVCEVIIIALIARPFIPGLEKILTIGDTIYGSIVFMIFYISAMRLLRHKK